MRQRTRWLLTLLLLTAWGCGNDEQPAGDGVAARADAGATTEASTPEPEKAPAPVIPITAGSQHTCLVKSNGEVYCWGRNLDSELGDGTSQNRFSPVPVAALTQVKQVDSEDHHTCAVRDEGTVWCWGRNEAGQLGRETPRVSTEPIQVAGIGDAVQVSTGSDFACALRAEGSVTCWGNGDDGRLGQGNTKSSTEPVAVADLTGVRQIASGRGHTCAVTEAGEVWCWGSNAQKQSALPGDMRHSPRPHKVAGLTGIAQVGAGTNTTCAVGQGGSLHCWGYNYYGQVGNGQSGSGNDVAEPFQVPGLQEVAQVDVGEYHVCAITSSGAAHCWGNDGYGNLGGAERGDQTSPQAVANVNDATAVALGDNHVCALRRSGALACWGRNESGQLGAAEIDDPYHATDVLPSVEALTAPRPEAPSFTPDPSVPVAAEPMISASEGFACALRTDGQPICWGGNSRGQLGDGTTVYRRGEVVEVSGISDAVEVEVAAARSCVRRANGTVACWGSLGTYNGQKNVRTSRPLPLEGVTGAVELALGGYSYHTTCFRRADNTVSCLRQGRFEPVEGLADVAQVVGNYGFACARLNNGGVMCWGNGSDGRLGNGATDSSQTPVEVTGIRDATDLTAGNGFTCALRRSGRVSCWGSNDDGQLGNGSHGDDEYSDRPVEVTGLRNVVDVSAGMNHACALQRDGGVVCWGGNTFNQCGVAVPEGQERPEHVLRPTPVQPSQASGYAALGRVVSLDCAWHVSCALHETGGVSCWGTSGVLGGGMLGGLISERSPSPVPLADVRLRPVGEVAPTGTPPNQEAEAPAAGAEPTAGEGGAQTGTPAGGSTVEPPAHSRGTRANTRTPTAVPGDYQRRTPVP